MEKVKISLEEACQLDGLLSRFGITLSDCDFGSINFTGLLEFQEVSPQITAFLSEAASKVGNSNLKNDIKTYIGCLGKVSTTLSQVLYYSSALVRLSILADKTQKILSDGK